MERERLGGEIGKRGDREEANEVREERRKEKGDIERKN